MNDLSKETCEACRADTPRIARTETALSGLPARGSKAGYVFYSTGINFSTLTNFPRLRMITSYHRVLCLQQHF